MSNDFDETTQVERYDTGVSITTELKRGTGTRDQDKIVAKVKAKTLTEARETMDELKPDLERWADEMRAIQPGDADE